MSLPDLLPKLVPGHPERGVAARALLHEVRRFASRHRAQPHDEDSVVSAVVLKVLVHVESGASSRWLDPAAYVRQMVRNAYRDLLAVERDQEALRKDEELQEPAAPAWTEEAEAELEALRSSARAILSRVLDSHLGEAPARYRAARENTFRQLCAVAFDGQDLHAVIRQEEGLTAHFGEQFEAALTRAYQAHARLRTALHETIGRLESAGRMSAREAQRARECLGLLIRAGVRRGRRGRSGHQDESP